jgi:hypothetical protein
MGYEIWFVAVQMVECWYKQMQGILVLCAM